MVQENPSSLFSDVPATWREMSAGSMFTCGRRSGSEVACWGSPMNGQLGLGVQNTSAVLAPETLFFNTLGEVFSSPPPPVAPASPVIESPANAPEVTLPVPNNATEIDQGSDSSIGAIVGGVVGGLVVLTLAGFLIWFFVRRRKKSRESSSNSEDQSNPSEVMEDIEQAKEGHLEEETIKTEEIQENTDFTNMADASDPKEVLISFAEENPPDIVEADTLTSNVEMEEAVVFNDRVQDSSEEIGEDEKYYEKMATPEEKYTTISTLKLESPQVRNFDTMIIQKKLNFTRSRPFLSLYQKTKHFDRAVKPSSKKYDDSISWYNPPRIFSKHNFSEYIRNDIDIDSVNKLSELWESGGNEKKAFLQEYIGKIHGLQLTRQELDNLPEERRKISLSESCHNISTLIEDIRPILWDLAMTKSPFHMRRKRFNVSWDESRYLKVYGSVQRVLLQSIQNALNLMEQDDRYVI